MNCKMGGLVIDIFLMFFVKAAIRTFRFIRSERWVRTVARILDVTLLDPDMGCPLIRVDYQVIFDDQTLSGREEIPYCFRWSAKQYAQLLSRNPILTVRVNPDNPEEMRFFELDQERAR
jgi:hypothetical protein